MADINKIIPFFIKWESGLPVKYRSLPVREQFEMARQTAFANDPADSGGATMCGVTIGTFTSYRKKVGKPAPTVADLKNITFDEWLDILRTLYWNRWKADQIKSQKIANILVDWVWGSGVYGIKIPQRALRLNPDGIVGPKTLATINNLDPNVLYKALYELRVDYFNDIIARSVAQYEMKIGRKATDKELKKYTYVRFKIGWMNRLNDIINIK